MMIGWNEFMIIIFILNGNSNNNNDDDDDNHDNTSATIGWHYSSVAPKDKYNVSDENCKNSNHFFLVCFVLMKIFFPVWLLSILAPVYICIHIHRERETDNY